MKTIVIIAEADEWTSARETGKYTRSTIDSTLEEVGFIHCSSPHQVIGVANRRFTNRDHLLLLFIDADKVKSPVKYEAASSGELYPHLYGPLNTDAVFATVPLEKNARSGFAPPPELLKQIKNTTQ